MMKGWGIVETIHEQLLHITLRIETFDKDNRPISIGTGMILGIIAMTMIRNNRLQAIPTGTVFQTEEVLGLGIVFKATSIKKLIDTMPFD